MTNEHSVSVAVERFRVVEVDFQTNPAWDRFVAAHPSGLIYHHSGWLQALEREYGQRCLSLACEDANGEIQGVLPLFYTRGLPFRVQGFQTGRRLTSLPRTPLAGPLSSRPEATVALIQAAMERVRERPGVQLEIKTSQCDLAEAVEGLVCIPWRLTYVRDLPRDPKELRFGDSSSHASVKRAVNKATRLGVQVRVAESAAELRDWYFIYLATMRRNAIPPRPFRFFAAVWELLQPRGLMQLLLAEQHQAKHSKLIAGTILFMFGQAVVYAFGGCREEDFSLRPNDILYWQGINNACRSGFRSYDFGEVPEGHEGLSRYKSKWANQTRRLYRYYYPASSHDRIGLRASAAYGKYLELAWSRLPLRVTEQLGNWLYSFL